MAGYPILKNIAFDFPIEYIDSSDDKTHKLTPTIAAGDVKISKDFGAFANLATLPSVAPAGGSVVKHELSAAEMNGDVIVIEGKDAAGAEWNDWSVTIFTGEFQVGADLVDAVWDEVNKGSDHNVKDSTGKQQRQASGVISGQAQAGTASTITFPTDVSAVDDVFNGGVVVVIDGTGVGQHRVITNYVGATRIATISPDWNVIPDATSELTLAPGRVNLDTVLLSAINALIAGRLDANVTAWLGLPVPSLNAAAITSSVAAGDIVVKRGDSWSITPPALGDITGFQEVWLSVKDTFDDSENDAQLRISETTGLERLLKAAATAANGVLTVSDASTGIITATLVPADSATFLPGSYKYDIQWKDANGEIFTLEEGVFVVTGDISLATD